MRSCPRTCARPRHSGEHIQRVLCTLCANVLTEPHRISHLDVSLITHRLEIRDTNKHMSECDRRGEQLFRAMYRDTADAVQGLLDAAYPDLGTSTRPPSAPLYSSLPTFYSSTFLIHPILRIHALLLLL